jgi:hypothetical protein
MVPHYYYPNDYEHITSHDYRWAFIEGVYVQGHNYEKVYNDISFQELRKIIFQGMHTRDLLSGQFSCVTSDPLKNRSNKPTKFIGSGDLDEESLIDGAEITLYMRNSDNNSIMRDIKNALPKLNIRVFFSIKLDSHIEPYQSVHVGKDLIPRSLCYVPNRSGRYFEISWPESNIVSTLF